MADNAAKAEEGTKEEIVQPATSASTSTTTQQSATAPAVTTAPTVEDDSDPDFDDLDDVLDQFAANAPSKQQPAPTSAPTVATSNEPQLPPQSTPSDATKSTPDPKSEPTHQLGPQANESEDEFLNRLTNEMAAMLPSIANDPLQTTNDPQAQAKMAAELEALTHKMEADGMKPEDLLKMIFGPEEAAKLTEAAAEEATANAGTSSSTGATAAAAAATSSASASASASKRPTSSGSTATATGTTTFEDTIRRTMSRLDQSNTEATNATAQSSTKSEEDLLAEMMKAFEAGGGAGGAGGDEDGLSKMFLDMMQQLTHKDVLYEPMKELHDQYPSWLASHQPPKLSQEEFDRYSRQSRIVAEITTKFEDPRFSDEDAGCREFIWEKMQQMQGEGAPPEELVKNPFPGTEFGGMPGLGGGGGGGDGPEEGCPTQ